MSENIQAVDQESMQIPSKIEPMVEEEDSQPRLSILHDSEMIAGTEFPPVDEEIIETKCFHWEVHDLTHLNDRVVGPTMEAGGHNWNLLLFPRGNGQIGPYMSLYLNLAQDNPEEYACAQFILGISKPSDPTVYSVHNAHSRFAGTVLDWGFNKFISMKDLMKVMENGCIRITTIIRIYKDSTGILWHNLDNYDSKKVTGYVGLQNQGATCYMNSLFQSLYFTNYFRKAVYQIPTENDEPTSSIALALQRVFYNLQFSDNSVGTKELTTSFGWDYYEAFRQHDVQEFNRVLQDNLELKMKNTPADGATKRLFLGRMKSYIKCINVDFESSRSEDYYDIQLNVKGCKNLEESFKDYITEETLEGENKYMAEGHGLQDAKKGVIFESFPPVLHLQLKRFEYDMYTDMMVKINDRHEFPTEIDLEPYLSEHADKSKPHKYKLYGVLVHSGDLTSGHYFAFVKPDKEDKWFRFDDDYVLPVTMKNVLEENFGGELLDPPHMNTRHSGRPINRFTNAYMLVYIRECMEDEIMAPVTDIDIPKHLTSRIEDEARELEIRRKQVEESHLYLTVVIADNNSFSRNMGYDIADFDERYFSENHTSVFKVRKDQPFGEFKEGIADALGLKTSDFRFWSMTNRQNNTLRLDTFITAEEDNSTIEEIRAKRSNNRLMNLRLYLEKATMFDVKNNPIFPMTMSGPETIILLFVKLFKPQHQAVQGIGHIYARRNALVKEIVDQLKQMVGFSEDEEILIYEEVKPAMIIPVNVTDTFTTAELQSGDILCIQKKLTLSEEQAVLKAGGKVTVDAYLEYERDKIDVSFAPISNPRSPEFELPLHKDMTYDEISDAVATELGIHDNKLRLINPYFNGYQRRFNGLTLGQISQIACSNKIRILYERLSMSLEELESKCEVFVTVCSPTLRDTFNIELLIPKDSGIDYFKEAVASGIVEFDSSHLEHIRIYDEKDRKFNQEYDDKLWRQYVSHLPKLYVYAEQVPTEELEETLNKSGMFISVFHFQRIPSRKHSIPFKFLLKESEPLAETKKRLQARIGLQDNEWSKVKINLVSEDEREIVPVTNDEAVLFSSLAYAGNVAIGLDHIDKNAKVDKTGAISIRG